MTSCARRGLRTEWPTLQEVRSGTFLMVDRSMRLAWVQFMHLVVKYSVLKIGAPALIHSRCSNCTNNAKRHKLQRRRRDGMIHSKIAALGD